MTQSDNDNEALNAIRLANSMLKKAGKGWASIFGLTFNGISEQIKKRQQPYSYEITYDEMPGTNQLINFCRQKFPQHPLVVKMNRDIILYGAARLCEEEILILHMLYHLGTPK